MTTKRAAIYMRVSTQWQVDNGVSLQLQEEELLEHVRKNDYSLDKDNHIFIDAWVSGIKEDREGLKSLMKAADRWEIDVILVYKIDRLFRKTVLLIQYVELLNDYWVIVVSITQSSFDQSWGWWKILLSVFATLAEMERDLIRERTMEWKRKKAKMWYYVWGWKPPFWYSFHTTSLWNKLKVDEDEKRVVNKIFELYVNEKKSLGEVVKILERDGELTRDDKILALWEQKSKKIVSGRWHWTVVRRILKDERYIWKYYYWKTRKELNKKTKKIETVQSPKEHMIELSCEPILNDFSLFEKAEELLELNKKTKNTKTGYPLTGLIFCSHCWKNYVGYRHSKDKKWYSYRCNGKMKYKKTDIEPRCEGMEVSGMYVLNEIWDKIYEIFKSPDNALKKYYNEKKSHSDIDKFQKQIDRLEEWIKKYNGWIKDAIKLQIDADKEDRPIYEEVIAEKRNNVRESENGIRELEQKIESLKNLEYAKNNLNKLKEYYDEKITNITEEKKIEIIQELVYRITIKPNGAIDVLFKFQEFDDEWDNDEWVKPEKKEINFQDELDNDASYGAIKNLKQKFNALTTTTSKFSSLKTPLVRDFFDLNLLY